MPVAEAATPAGGNVRPLKRKPLPSSAEPEEEVDELEVQTDLEDYTEEDDLPEPVKKKASAPKQKQSDKELMNIGHNSKVLMKFLQTGVDNIEKLEEKKRALNEQIKAEKSHLKEQGIAITPLNHVLKLRRMESDARKNFMEDQRIIMDGLGMQASLFHGEDFSNAVKARKEAAGDPAAAAKAKAKKPQTASKKKK